MNAPSGVQYSTVCQEREVPSQPRFLIRVNSDIFSKFLSSWLSDIFGANEVLCVDETYLMADGVLSLDLDFLIVETCKAGQISEDLRTHIQKKAPKCFLIYLHPNQQSESNERKPCGGLVMPILSDYEQIKSFKQDLFRTIKEAQLAFAQLDFAQASKLIQHKATRDRPPMKRIAEPKPTLVPLEEQRVYRADGETYPLRAKRMGRPRALIIGCSTGGPPAISRVLADIETVRHLVPIFIVQHIQKGFVDIFASNISKLVGQPALIAKEGMQVRSGDIYLAPFGFHMLLERRGAGIFFTLDNGPEVHYCKPAVDPSFESAANIYGGGVLGVVLTGLGEDAGKGAEAVANAHGTVLAQDRETSVVWGMPKAAAKTGACNEILPLREIGPAICEILSGAQK